MRLASLLTRALYLAASPVRRPRSHYKYPLRLHADHILVTHEDKPTSTDSVLATYLFLGVLIYRYDTVHISRDFCTCFLTVNSVFDLAVVVSGECIKTSFVTILPGIV